MSNFEEFKNRVCDDLDNFRQAKGLKKEDLARLSSKCPSFIVALTKGQTSPTIRTLYEVASAMGAEVKIEFRSSN